MRQLWIARCCLKLANRKALPKFILVLVICMAVGWAVGYLSGRFRLDRLTDCIRSAGAFFGAYLAPRMIVERKSGELEVINLDFVTRIREYPRKKNGKKKEIVLD